MDHNGLDLYTFNLQVLCQFNIFQQPSFGRSWHVDFYLFLNLPGGLGAEKFLESWLYDYMYKQAAWGDRCSLGFLSGNIFLQSDPPANEK